MAVGSFRRLEEVGRGSFATVYKGSMSVSEAYSSFLNKVCVHARRNLLIRLTSSMFVQNYHSHVVKSAALMRSTIIEEAWLRCHQVRRSE